ncbi:glutaminyl-peptide cyclotransferase [Sphingomonas aerolata]|uniref:glutaminyl-peptide cyclotransferase n=1 Tax=Sphingomonas aerolata TaxID=185951 RepID=UPI000D3542D8|nr:glutaminyl-peptide cyclotransferase [Sphingomonas aerolata]
MTIGHSLIAAGLALAGPAVAVLAQGATAPRIAPAPTRSAVRPAPPKTPVSATAPAVPILSVSIVARYPHDATAFTEGLLWHDGALYESTGKEGQSDVRRVTLLDGRIVARRRIDPAQFGEGLGLWKNELISLTWHDGIAHRWDARTLKPTGTNRYAGEGWGLTSDKDGLIQSDGSASLILRDPRTLAERRRIGVTIDGRPLTQLNELEYVDGAILANVWQTGYLVRIAPGTGRVTAIIDLRPLVAEIGARDRDAVLNGIAWDAAKKRLFVTGKLWPTLFEIRING